MIAKRMLALAGLSLLGIFIVSMASAQTAGDFRSFQTGNWNDVNSWERYDGGTWVHPAPNTPTSADGAVTLRAGHVISLTATDSIDQLVMEGTSALQINNSVTFNIENGAGTDFQLYGTLDNAGVITLDAGAEFTVGVAGIYRHVQNGGTIPTATWELGSHCEVTGAVGNAPGNANQNFYNFVWHCPGQTSNLNVAWNNITIGGNVTVMSTGTARFQLTNNTFSGTTITINGDLIVMGGQVASNGSSGAATYTIEVLGDVLVTGGNLGVSRGSGGNATWRLHGDLSVVNATIQSSNPQSRFVFVKPDTQRVSFTGVTNTGVFHYEVDTSTVIVIVDGPDAIDVSITDSLICRGEVLAQGAMSFTVDAVYVHGSSAKSVPIATWEAGSTCEVRGYTSGTKPGNLNQNFDDFIWNCPAQTANVDWGWFGNTIAGDLIVRNTGTARAYLTSPGAGTPNTITINGNIMMEAGQFSSNGSSSAADITVNTLGNITVLGGNFAISRGSQASGAGSVIWNVFGNVSMSNATTQNSNPTEGKAKFVFTRDGSQTLALTNVTFGGGGMPIEVDSAAVLVMGESVVSGSGMFRMLPFSTLETANAGGLDSSLQMTGTVSFDGAANFTFNGVGAQLTGFLLPDSCGVLTFSNASGVALIDTVTCAALHVPAGMSLSIVDTASLTAWSGAVGGTILNRGNMSGSPSLVFESGGLYQHDRNGGSIATALWNAGSTCLITGATSSAPGNANQNFYNFTWNCPGQTAGLNAAWSGNTIGGDVTVLASGSSQFRMSNNTAHLAPITIMGDAVVGGGALTATGSSGAATYTIVVLGDVLATAGNLAPSRGSGGIVNWYIEGDFNVSNATLQTSNSQSRFLLSGTAPQTVTISNVSYTGAVNMDVDTAAIVDMGSSAFGGTGTFTVHSGATLASGHPNGLDGNLTSTTVVLSMEADYGFNGAAAQSTGMLLPATVNRLIVDNSSGVSLAHAVVVSDSVVLNAGTLALGAHTLTAAGVAGASPSAYCLTDGAGGLAIPAVGTTAAHFPVGTASTYAPAWITNAGTADAFTVSAAPDAGTSDPRVNLKWTITEGTAGGSNATVQLGWMASAENAAFASDRAANAKMFNLADTTEAGAGTYTSQFTSEPYTLSRGGFTVFSPLAVGNFTGGSTSILDPEAIPTVFAVGQNYPNPFNPTTVISYDVPTASHVSIVIYDALGRAVSTLVDEEHVPGSYTAQWSASGYASGVYYYRIVAGDFVAVKKMMLVR